MSRPDAIKNEPVAGERAASQALVAAALSKSYGARIALDAFDLVLARGEIVGLLGPNGAGKTTTLSILSGVIPPDRGSVSIAGRDLCGKGAEARRQVGLAPQSLAIYPSLTARENLVFFGRMQGLSHGEANAAAQALLKQAGLADRADDLAATFSGGMQRRLNMVCAMPHRPALILLDQATAGVDPQSRELIFTMVENAAADGAACLYSTHYMEEAERLCHRVILLDHGRIVAAGTPPQLIARAGGATRIDLVTRTSLPPGWINGLRGVKPVASAAHDARATSISVEELEQVPSIIARAGAAGGGVVDFNLRRANLQDAFIALTGHALRD